MTNTKKKKLLAVSSVVLGVAVLLTGVLYSSATAILLEDHVGQAEVDAYRGRWDAEANFGPNLGPPEPTSPICAVAGQGPTCPQANNSPLCRPPGVRPQENAVAAAVMVVRVAAVLYAAYKAQAGEPNGYALNYSRIKNGLENTLNDPILRGQWVSWASQTPARLAELRRVRQAIPPSQTSLISKYQELIDPQNNLSLSTPWDQTPGL